MGTPHRVVVDEGHHFLRDAVNDQLLDADFNGYTVVTYRPSQLPKELVAATEVILVTRSRIVRRSTRCDVIAPPTSIGPRQPGTCCRISESIRRSLCQSPRRPARTSRSSRSASD